MEKNNITQLDDELEETKITRDGRVPIRKLIDVEIFRKIEKTYEKGKNDRRLSYISVDIDFFDDFDTKSLILDTDAGCITYYLYLRHQMARSQNGFYIDVTKKRAWVLINDAENDLHYDYPRQRWYMNALISYGFIIPLEIEEENKMILTDRVQLQNFETLMKRRIASAEASRRHYEKQKAEKEKKAEQKAKRELAKEQKAIEQQKMLEQPIEQNILPFD